MMRILWLLALLLCVSALAPVRAAVATLNVLSPKPYQVFQRETRLDGHILLSAQSSSTFDQLAVRVTGPSLSGPLLGQWQIISTTLGISVIDPSLFVITGVWSMPGTSVDASLPVSAGGWYTVEIVALRMGVVVATASIANVGVGEVFVGAGQSNSTNSGEECTQITTGMVSSFDGSDWRLADDPQLGVHDRTGSGSFWPTFGDALYRQQHVPIGVAVTGQGASSTSRWRPGGELFNWTMQRICRLGRGGFRAVLWHQGESDTGMPADQYVRNMTDLIYASKRIAGWDFPWFTAQATYHNPKYPSFADLRKAQQQLWTTGVSLQGPDTDTLTEYYRDRHGRGIHFNRRGLIAHGKLWADKVNAYLEKVLAD